MKLSKHIYTLLLVVASVLLSVIPYSKVLATTYDFVLTNNTTVKYTTGIDYVHVSMQFLREVKNSSYYFPTTGEQAFHIPDLLSSSAQEVADERAFKKNSITVTNESGKAIAYSIEELENGEGMYIKVPNYKRTTISSPYRLNVTYTTHDYIQSVYNLVLIEYPGLHEDTEFEYTQEQTGTTTKRNYNLSIEVDSNIPPLAKIYPTQYTHTSDELKSTYSFESAQRIGQPVYLEFGTDQIYKFELTLKTKKTDNIIPERYSSAVTALSTNIYELALPREFAENKQTVKIEKITPLPTKLITTTEGNVVATFEVPANKEDEIYVSGYVWVQQQPYSEKKEVPNLSYEEYVQSISSNSQFTKYLQPTKFWEIYDPFVQAEAKKLLLEKTSLLDVIRGNYTYINEIFEYDEQRAADPNAQRLGAKAALQGGAVVCMEYADSMVALLRAQKIPSRAAFGYTSMDSNIQKRVSHQWVQVWIPEYGWLSIDPSYESKNMMIGQSIQYVLWDTLFDDNFVDIKAYSADTFDFDSSGYEVKVYAVEEDSIPDTLLSYSEIVTETEQHPTKDTLNLIVKTTPPGKALIIILPITLVLFLLILLFSLIVLLIKRLKGRRASSNQLP